MTRLTNRIVAPHLLDHASDELAAEAASLRVAAYQSVERQHESGIALMLFEVADEVEAFAADLASIGR